MRPQVVLGVTLSAILILGMNVGALAQEKFSARVLAKGSNSNILILVKNSSLSTASVNQFQVVFTQGAPISSIGRGWSDSVNGNTVTFTAARGPMAPGGTAIFLIKVNDPATSAFNWSVTDSNGNTLQSGQVPKIRVRESKPAPSPIPAAPEISVNQVRVNPGGQLIVTGKGFSALSSVQLFLENQQQLTSTNTNGNGEFNTVIIMPSSIAPGSHLINAKDALGKSSVIQVLVELLPGQQPLPPDPGQVQLILTAKTDKTEYSMGDTIKITGTAVLETPVSLQITDPTGGIICGANPHVNNYTMTWEAACFIPANAVAGTYILQAKQVVHKTSVRFMVKGVLGPGGSPSGEDPGTLKLSTDKLSYKSGESVVITVQGARAKSIVQLVILAPSGPPLEAKQVTTNDNGVVSYSLQLVAAQTGVYKISAKQDKFIVRSTFEVTT
jgi:hypothetical protein